MVFLIGFMGCGKSTAGKRLSEKHGCPFYDLDRLIEEKTGMTIPVIFRERGEKFFREIESELLETMTGDGICATGGGIVESETNRDFLMRPEHTTIFLDVPWDLLWNRIRNSDRPLLQGKTEQDIHDLYTARLPFYKVCADFIVDEPGTWNNHTAS